VRKRNDDAPLWVIMSLPPAGRFWYAVSGLFEFAVWLIRRAVRLLRKL
jgi:hypothetical protein